MLINCVKEDDDKRISERGDSRHTEDYHTPSELFEVLAKNPHRNGFDGNGTLATQDLVILYENADLGIKPVSSSKEFVNKKSNQYVETIVYKDENDSEDSEVYEIYSNEDLHDVVTINNERIDLLTCMPSFENSLCHKFGNIHLKSSNLANDYDKHFLFNNPLLQEQLQSLHAMSDTKDYKSTILPASLLDYICCKHLDDNYSYYMDNVIKYVQHTIEQLKRISNGDYLTEKAKEKWREVQHVYDNNVKTNDNKNICLAPIINNLSPIEEKVNRPKDTWDEIVHSEMDVRCLRKILEKKIVLEIPKILSGSYRIFTKKNNDAVVIKCNRVKNPLEIKNDKKLVLKLKNSEPKSFISNKALTSLPTNFNIKTVELINVEYNDYEKIQITEVDDNGNDICQEEIKTGEEIEHMSMFVSNIYDSSTDLKKEDFDKHHFTTHQIIHNRVLEETKDITTRIKSPTRIRIKSPYENKSHLLEEKRRKRLLEIREKREKKKLAMNENCKITKHKYAKGAIMAQASNSVTKLSITNKSFYNSIYGQTHAVTLRNNHTFQKQDNIPDLQIHECDEEESINDLSNHQQEGNNQKYINRSYYLDDADTEVMYLQMTSKQAAEESNEFLTPSTSLLSNDIGTDELQLTYPSITDFNCTETTTSLNNYLTEKIFDNNINETLQNVNQDPSILVPTNTPKHKYCNNDKNKNIILPDECKKGIGEIDDSMNTIVSLTNLQNPVDNTKLENSASENVDELGTETTTRESTSGTSLKHQFTSNPSSLSFEKTLPEAIVTKMYFKDKKETMTAILPKVILNPKYQAGRSDGNKPKKEMKKPDQIYPDNPLKAISQLIHNIDNIQKTRHKSGNDSIRERKSNHRKNYNLTSEVTSVRHSPNKSRIIQEKTIKQQNTDSSRFSKAVQNPVKGIKLPQQSTKNEKPAIKKKLADIIDEVKEMRGEAVRGPPKGLSRIDNLAKPKKAYVKAQNEEYQNRFNRTAIPKVEKSTINPHLVQDNNLRTKYRNRQKTSIDISATSVKHLHKTQNSPDKSVKLTNPAYNSLTESFMYLPQAESTKVTSYTQDFQTDPFEKKMVAVETYVKHHFSRLSPSIVKDSKDHVQNSRVPLIPTDLASTTSSPLAEESTTLGKKLHDMIHFKITSTASNVIINSKKDPTSKTDIERIQSYHHFTKCPTDVVSSNSDYPIDVLKDKNIVTAVACVSEEDSAYKSNNQSQDPNLDSELHHLENALYRQISSGTFQKRLRLKNLTLTPKQSTQHIIVMQSGDDRSLMVKTSLSQKINISKTDSFSKLHLLPVMSYDALNLKLPMQIATVGFVFPEYQTLNKTTYVKTVLPRARKFSKTDNCFKEHKLQFKDKCDLDNSAAYINNTSLLQNNENNKALKNDTCVENDIKKVSTGDISNSTSLDILLGLLNEIKKITACESNFVSSGKDTNPEDDSKEVTFILNNTDRKTVTDPPLDNLRKVQSSNISLSTSNTDDNKETFELQEKESVKNCKRYLRSVITTDIAIDVQNTTKEVSDRFTDVPSGIFHNTVNRSASAISSLMAVFNGYSKDSCSFSEYQTSPSKSSLNETSLIPFVPKNNSLLDLNYRRINTQITEGFNTKALTVIYDNEKYRNKYFCNRSQNDCDFDSTLKVKRDVLVTFYSLLVLTMFAALTFPGFLYNT